MVLRTYNKSIVELVIADLESFLKIKNNAIDELLCEIEKIKDERHKNG